MGSLQKALAKGLLKIFKTVQKKRFKETVEKALMDQGKTIVWILITKKLTCLKDIMKTNLESTNGEFDVDSGKFFKKQAANLDRTIFET
jgi:formyltetrahydrofolate hydrolase